MKRIIVPLVAGLALMAAQVFAGNGDLIVDHKVGIGNSAPQAALDLGAWNRPSDYHVSFLWYNDNNSGPYAGTKGGIYLDQFGLANNTTAVFASSVDNPGTYIIASKDTSDTSLIPRVTIQGQTGNVGIGTTGPIYKLSVDGALGPGNNTRDDGGYGGIDFTNNGIGYQHSAKIYTFRSDISGEYYGFTNDYDGVGAQLSIISKQATGNIGFYTGNPATRKMSITAAGNVGIGTTSPSYTLDVNGTIRGNNVSPSDVRFKENIVSVDAALKKVLTLQGVSFDWKRSEFKDKNFPEGRHYGVIAQEIEKVLPEVVNTAADGTKAVAYTEIIPVLIEAIKEQQALITQQKALIENQQQEISAIKMMIQKIR